MWVLLGTVFVASLLGSLHCVGMCGPFALMAGSRASSRKSAVVPAAAYSSGRLITYSIVGVVFGSLGLALNAGTRLAPWQQSATYAAGGLMILIGLIALARQFGWTIRLPGINGRIQKLLQSQYQTVIKQPPLRRAFLIGALSCLMPCGWLYTFAIVAAGTASPLWGGVVMVAFWFGTVPIMAALMLGFNRIGQSIQQHIPLAMASLVILVGLFTLAFRAPVVIGEESRVVAGTGNLVQQVQGIQQEELPCCSEN